MEKIPVGILGATGMVGQQYIALLENHPWFEVRYVAASPRSAGKLYEEAAGGRWNATRGSLGGTVAKLTVEDANDVSRAQAAAQRGDLAFVFSALEMEKDDIKRLEEGYAGAGIPVVSNASANRWTADIPMLIAEINSGHTDIIPLQQKNRGWDRGFIVVKPNCSIQSFMTPLFALQQAGYEVRRVIVNTLQAVSGAGYPGVSSLDILDNVVPYIGGEEEKTETEPLKILGSIRGNGFVNAPGPQISAHCNRVPVVDGHTACVSLEFGGKKPSPEEVRELWKGFRALPQELDLPMPRKDRDQDKGMAVSVGRIRPCAVFDLRFVAVSHNTIRGAAGGGILNAELLKAKGYLGEG